MVAPNTYKFSFTASSLRTRDLVKVIRYQDTKSDEELELILGNGKQSTGRRLLREMKGWSKSLTDRQRELLLHSSFKTQNEIAFIAVCKYFDFIRDFVIEVVREKYLVYDYVISDGDYYSFFSRKCEYHPEMESLTTVTRKKVRQVLFRMLEQAGLIDSVKSKTIQPQWIDFETRKVILEDNPEMFKIFLFGDVDIEIIKENK
ncbi:DUF1819 family protein [Flagellimonas alvinocaridis]|uniref:DUF1819 family protein n=1 Tax=Flagellimonas alvinocaridis TaxID=2530200 RepID=A0A4S8RQ78_9FLAO|nr:DUF1819 family protein [Allomuricauda alvinocaridis]THV60828.1 DUF1819 family protein [Allomuricauda alvinocaridis]